MANICLKSALSVVLGFRFGLGLPLYVFHFSLFVGFPGRDVSFLQTAKIERHFIVHSTNQCLLDGMPRPFSIRIISEYYITIPPFSILQVTGLLS